mmetsp:Transcript_28493/g.37282  ORF Transcript_28493/g.37282 Transcript_28493/m.37282 type:complete len:288 (-) Transcript_28493:80-943(-)
MMFLSSLMLIIVALARDVAADKCTNHYPGFEDPNCNYKMYWADAVNVLQDLSKFKALYIKYHACVWSAYGSGEEDNGNCGEDGGEDYWYMGRTQCFRANAAYSLYGVTQDTKYDPSLRKSKCNKWTYINSFFTMYGAEIVSDAVGFYDDYGTSICTSNGNYSTTMGCSAGKFVKDNFKGSWCNGQYYLNTTDTLDDYNHAMESTKCTRVWDSSQYANKIRNLQEAEHSSDEAQGDYEGYGSPAEKILYFSKACNIRQYPNECPDPHGLKEYYTKMLERASGWSMRYA